MLTKPPREPEWRSWLWVILWSIVIYVTIPFARAIQKWVQAHAGREWFGYAVIAIVLLAAVRTIVFLVRHRVRARGSYVWLSAVAVVFVWYTIELWDNAEEAMHFVQYGVLGLLIYRALTHRVRDVTIYFTAAVIGAIVGTIDEAIQWATPDRYWALRDIWLNFFAVALVQVAIARGLKPPLISSPIAPVNVQRLCRFAVVALLLLAASLLNTPARIDWYASRIPFLRFLKTNESVMFEYGYLYEDPDIGVFRSRLSPEELARTDRERGENAARILDQYQGDEAYRAFLKRYTPVSDPFLHEARVHLFSRDRLWSRAESYRDQEHRFRPLITRAYREHLILAKYFSHTLKQSAYTLSPEQVAFLEEHQLPDFKFESRVSNKLVTGVTEGQIAMGFGLLCLGLTLVHVYVGKNRAQTQEQVSQHARA